MKASGCEGSPFLWKQEFDSRTFSVVELLDVMFLRIFLFGAVLTAQAGSLKPENPAVYEYDVDSYAVYSAVLNKGLFTDDRSSKWILISGATEPESEWDAACPTKLAKHDPEVRNAVDAYQVANQHDYVLRPDFVLQKPYSLMSISEWNTLFAALFDKDVMAGWKNFHEFNPGVRGIYSLSAVGFNNKKTAAIVHVSFFCGALCADTRRFLVRKVKGKWNSVTDLGCGGVS